MYVIIIEWNWTILKKIQDWNTYIKILWEAQKLLPDDQIFWRDIFLWFDTENKHQITIYMMVLLLF